ncbi:MULTISPECIES: NADP-dependent oxidoreductase [Rhodomicrobium]|uniref:NADP-dependent oxidoreductase n=1 Tax=Rhodomicrobium TaxID=1068 RepID=UPI000B4A7DEA|nr:MULTISPECIES: NADP-dependent oxidoreductase [Rhodomicrobium]
MLDGKNRQIIFASRPEGEPVPTNFAYAESAIPEPGEGQVLLRNRYLSLDPYMRGRMSVAKSYAKGFEIGAPLGGGTVSEVIRSHHPKLAPGDLVSAFGGWQDYAVANGEGLIKIDPTAAPVTTALGVLGMPGMTAYTGLLNIGQPKAGETLVVAAAAGPVGATVGQIARIKGCRAVGIAGADKLAYLKDELGFDAVIDRRSPQLADDLRAACPDGIDIYFENVGGAVRDAVLPLLNDFARIPLCGLVAHYNDTRVPDGPDRLPQLMRMILTKRLRIQGFIVSDFNAQYGDFLRDVGGWLREGRIKYREHVVDGLEKAPEAFVGMLRGDNFGKVVVRVGE